MIVIYSLFFILFLFLFLPIRIGVLGRYEEEGGVLCGWVRPWSGLWGVRVIYKGGRVHIGPMLWAWAPWRILLRPREKEVVGTEVADAEGAAERRRPSIRERLAEGLDRAERVWSYFGPLRAPVWRFLKRLLRGFRFRRFVCRLVFGAPDPATTGQIFGYAQAISNVMSPRAQVNVLPDFEQKRLEGEVEVEVSVTLYRLLWAVFCLVLRVAGAWVADAWNRWRRPAVDVSATQ